MATHAEDWQIATIYPQDLQLIPFLARAYAYILNHMQMLPDVGVANTYPEWKSMEWYPSLFLKFFCQFELHGLKDWFWLASDKYKIK